MFKAEDCWNYKEGTGCSECHSRYCPLSENQLSKGSVTLPLEEYERLKESGKKLGMDLELAYEQMERLMTLLKKIGIPLDVVRILKQEDVNVFWDDNIDQYARKYLIEIQLPMDRLHEKKEEE